MKKALVAAIFLITVMWLFPVQALASTGYESRLEAPDHNNEYYYSSKNTYYRTGYGMPNCVAYAYGRVYEINDKAPLISRGNAGEWWGINKRGGLYEYGSEPKEGAIACWSGHVAVVETVNDDGTCIISESHYGGKTFDTNETDSKGKNYGQSFYGFIYTYEEPTYKEKVYDFSQPEYVELSHDITVDCKSIEMPGQKKENKKILPKDKMFATILMNQ